MFKHNMYSKWSESENAKDTWRNRGIKDYKEGRKPLFKKTSLGTYVSKGSHKNYGVLLESEAGKAYLSGYGNKPYR